MLAHSKLYFIFPLKICKELENETYTFTIRTLLNLKKLRRFLHMTEYKIFLIKSFLWEDTHKKCDIFSGRTTKVLPSLHQWPSDPCHFFIICLLSYNSLKRFLTIFSFLPYFWANTAGF